MGKKKNKMKKEADLKENESKIESIVKLEINKMRSSADIEEDDDVVHDEESPTNQKTIPEVEFTEITNVPQERPEKQIEIKTVVPAEITEPKKSIAFREEAIPLIEWNQADKKFEVSQEAREIISTIQGPIGVITVAGMYRTGKSYLLNRVILNNSSGGFGVGPSINPCTKGLWVWAKPLVGYSENGTKINVIVVDSEGIGGLDEDGDHDMRIFSLALLLSSFFIYNSMGSIDENALSNLSFVSNISEHIKAKNNSEENLIEHMPKFVWVVRDFSL